MQEHLIIDGNNALHGIPELARELKNDRNQARESLLRYLEPLQQNEKYLLTVVFDGKLGRGRVYQHNNNKHYTVIYSASTQGADGVIERMLMAAKFPERISIATNDGLIRNCAYESGATAIRIEELSKKLDSTIALTRINISPKRDVEKGTLPNRIDIPDLNLQEPK